MAQRIKYISKEKNIFAATPPLEAQKLLLSMAVTEGVGFKRGERENWSQLAFIDAKRAYFYAKAKQDIFAISPEEDAEPGMCGILVKSMHGARDGAINLGRLLH